MERFEVETVELLASNGGGIEEPDANEPVGINASRGVGHGMGTESKEVGGDIAPRRPGPEQGVPGVVPRFKPRIEMEGQTPVPRFVPTRRPGRSQPYDLRLTT
jgi:hypothetical protein